MQVQAIPKYSIFLDISGSVGSSNNYWTTVKQIYELYSKDIKNYYEWDSDIFLVDQKKFQKTIQQRKGHNGTSPYVVAKECVNKNIKDIILITDGQVGDGDVRQCDQFLKEYKFDSTICYIISSGYGDVNLSVTCPFTRNCQNKVFKKLQNQPMQTIVQFTPQDYLILDQLDKITLENLDRQYDKIQGLIIALNMGKQGNIPLKNNLVVMKNRLVKEMSKLNQKQQQKDLSIMIREYLQKNDFMSAMNQMKRISTEYFSVNTGSDLQKKISHLINLCGDLRGKYNINQIKSNKMAIASNAIQSKIDKQVQVMDLSKNPIQCPILNDDDVPQILIDQCQPLLMGVQKYIVDDVVVCPLRILNYPELKAKLKSRLSNYVGVMGIKTHFGKDLSKNPFTQNRLLGGIPLGTHKSHVEVGNYTIAKLISGGKILGNLNMYYAVIWCLINQGSIEYLKDIEKNAAQHLIYRLKNSKSFASLCGQAQFVTTEVSTDVALWYCVNSGHMNQPTDRDTFRFHLFNIETIKRIVELLGYPIDKGFDGHYARTKTLFTMLGNYKKADGHLKISFKNLIKGLYQNCIQVNAQKIDKKLEELQKCSRFIPIDGPASEQQIKLIREKITKAYPVSEKLTNQQVYYLGSIIDAQKSASGYFLDYNFIAPVLPKHQISWKYGLVDHQNTVKVSPKSFRPYYYVNNHRKWYEQAEQVYKMPKQDMFKQFKYFQLFIFKYERLPNIDQLKVFFYNRFIEGNKCKSLPFMTQKWLKYLIEVYTPLFENKNIKDILAVFEEGREIQKRINME